MTKTDWVMVAIIVCGCIGLWIMYLIDKKQTREWNDFVRNVIVEENDEQWRCIVFEDSEQDEYIQWLYPEHHRIVWAGTRWITHPNYLTRYNPNQKNDQ